MRRMGNLTVIFLLFLVFLLLCEVFTIQRQYAEDSKRMVSRKAILQALGVSFLALSSECSATRSLIEGLCGCLSDMPGGYCPHSSCDVVTLPQFNDNQSFKLSIIKKSFTE